ncbi:MAG: hypothetical protein K0R57_1947 [Paenibacillaceae bacterium]|jgi:hypothetical protein|nr:hypothetical protein [Paenibacillaceae bacterium]
MAETYRKSKIESFCQRLEVRIRTLRSHLKQTDLSDKHDFLQGQLTALELVLQELNVEFELTNESEESS